MCNYELIAAKGDSVTVDDLLAQADFAVARLGDLAQYHYLFITSGGSFLDPREVPDDARLAILKRLRFAGLRRVSFESEAKYCLDLRRLRPIADMFPGSASVGIGLESADEFVRNVVVNKGLATDLFLRAAECLKTTGIGFYVYVLLGKPFLTRDEDERDCIETIAWARDVGAFMTVVESVNIQPFTLTHWLWERSRYAPPSLWSGRNVVLRAPAELRSGMSVKGLLPDEGLPEPVAVSAACPKCAPRLRDAITAWNFNRDFECLASFESDCECYLRYLADLAYGHPVPMRERVRAEIEAIHSEVVPEVRPGN
jgi:hypothetical protein